MAIKKIGRPTGTLRGRKEYKQIQISETLFGKLERNKKAWGFVTWEDYLNEILRIAKFDKDMSRAKSFMLDCRYRIKTLGRNIEKEEQSVDYTTVADVRELLKLTNCSKCTWCYNLELDHIIPFSIGGENTLNNLQILCRDCHLAKRAYEFDNDINFDKFLDLFQIQVGEQFKLFSLEWLANQSNWTKYYIFYYFWAGNTEESDRFLSENNWEKFYTYIKKTLNLKEKPFYKPTFALHSSSKKEDLLKQSEENKNKLYKYLNYIYNS